ncbi:hypothetical protein ACFVYA_48705 [Amycolatopsis sp. NPDC058278]|uniref:hypothetical protein n=1 Tax=Amycolatopsis sp. NPDC058278 TaxID=3346417 RepID=UPI0036DD4F5B
MKNLLDRVGRRGPIVMAVSGVILGLSLQPFIGTDGWAGLGQWVGGLGALFAAWAALRIAKEEAGRENQREVDRLRTQAYYVVAEITLGSAPQGFHVRVTNESTDPVLDIRVVGLVRDAAARDQVLFCKPDGEPPDVLLPGQPWETWLTPSAFEVDSDMIGRWVDAKVLLRFRDLARSRWERIGRRPPVTDESAQS